ncbi:hypothetical protein P691DRAFT_766061 [Macrolepiota fuliginosa MF-IS2]|uniref:Uncharacterized protein n=1 Tax=Macrolepiota fuliginosa MF-IS2 TaxID=1400762 RepID=A0A9P5X110_9AGAR|nr:hypothetical protein P691DRAFT_766061 [Macrolepiota fuliginosa MF-IS2]
MHLKKALDGSLSRDRTDMLKIDEVHLSNDDLPQMLCFDCSKLVMVLFWACITCNPKIYICNDYHILLRLHNTIREDFEVKTIDPQTTAVVTAVEMAVRGLESRINALEDRLTNTEGQVGSNVASLLKEIAQRLGISGLDGSAPSDKSATDSPPGDQLLEGEM